MSTAARAHGGASLLDGLPLQVRSAGIATYTEALVRAIARLRFTWERCAAETLAVYDDAADQP